MCGVQGRETRGQNGVDIGFVGEREHRLAQCSGMSGYTPTYAEVSAEDV